MSIRLKQLRGHDIESCIYHFPFIYQMGPPRFRKKENQKLISFFFKIYFASNIVKGRLIHVALDDAGKIKGRIVCNHCHSKYWYKVKSGEIVNRLYLVTIHFVMCSTIMQDTFVRILPKNQGKLETVSQKAFQKIFKIWVVYNRSLKMSNLDAEKRITEL